MTSNNSDLSTNAGLGSKNQTSERAVDEERQPMPDAAPEVDSDKPNSPAARTGGASQSDEKPTESGKKDNPVHHTGHIPPPVTANRE